MSNLFDHFKELNTNVNYNETLNTTVTHDEHVNFNPNDCLDSPIEQEEILKAITNLKSGKSPGIDNVLNEYIVNTKTHSVAYICIYV